MGIRAGNTALDKPHVDHIVTSRIFGVEKGVTFGSGSGRIVKFMCHEGGGELAVPQP